MRTLSIPLCLLAVCAAALPARADEFRYKFRAGQVTQNRISLAGATMMGAGGAPMSQAQFRTVLRQVQRVRSVAGGVATLEVLEAPISSTVTVAGRTEKNPEEPTRSIVKITERGRFINRKQLGRNAEMEGGSPLEGADALYGLNFPARNIKPGESWTDTLTVGSGAEARKVTVTTKYVKREKFRGKDCAKFASTLTTSLFTPAETVAMDGSAAPAGKVAGTITTYFDPAAGSEVYSSGSLSMVMRADLSALGPDAGEIATVTKVNVIQQALPPKSGRK